MKITNEGRKSVRQHEFEGSYGKDMNKPCKECHMPQDECTCKESSKNEQKMTLKSLRQIIRKILLESMIRRGWAGSLENVNDLLNSMKDKMRPADKNRYESMIHAYYRYFNDGDYNSLPLQTLKKYGLSDEAAEILKNGKNNGQKYGMGKTRYEGALEKALTAMLTQMLKQYKPTSQDRTDVLNSKKKETAEYALKNFDPYWIEKFGRDYGVPELLKLIPQLKSANTGMGLSTQQVKQQIKQLIHQNLGKTPIEEAKNRNRTDEASYSQIENLIGKEVAIRYKKADGTIKTYFGRLTKMKGENVYAGILNRGLLQFKIANIEQVVPANFQREQIDELNKMCESSVEVRIHKVNRASDGAPTHCPHCGSKKGPFRPYSNEWKCEKCGGYFQTK